MSGKIHLHPPRRKRQFSSLKQQPYPIGALIGNVPSCEGHYEGHLHGNRIVVCNPCHVENLLHLGFFGKEKLSPNDFSVSEPMGEVSQTVTKAECRLDSSASNLESTDVLQEQAKTLNLTLTEAFFLSYGLGCLTVTVNSQKINLEEMWLSFCNMDSFFLYKYIAYHHFRSKGWVVKPGIKFGVHYILYKDGPPFYHASYSVIVKAVDDQFRSISQDHINSDLGWSSLAGLNRITEHVAKDLLFCYVIQPTTLLASEMTHPKCISRFKVQEMLLRRWVSSEERESDNI